MARCFTRKFLAARIKLVRCLGVDVEGQGNAGSPGSGGASPYLSRCFPDCLRLQRQPHESNRRRRSRRTKHDPHPTDKCQNDWQDASRVTSWPPESTSSDVWGLTLQAGQRWKPRLGRSLALPEPLLPRVASPSASCRAGTERVSYAISISVLLRRCTGDPRRRRA
jgi:hypothetical protein